MLKSRPQFFACLTLILLWITVNLYFYLSTGPKYMTDSPRFVGTALEILKTGEVQWNYNYWSSGYIFFLLLLFKFDFTYKGIVAAQILISGFASITMYKIGERVKNRETGWVATLLFILWVPIQSWNVYLLTESLFISFSIITFWCVLTANSIKRVVFFFPIFFFAATLRPNGFTLLIAVFFYFMTSVFFIEKRSLYKILPLIVLSLIGLVCLINPVSKTYASIFIELFRKGEVIAGYDGITVDSPKDLKVPDAPSLFKIIELFFKNPLYSLKLMFLKLIVLFGHVKPFYSKLHNVFIVLTLYPVYYFSIRGFLSKDIPSAAKAFILVFIFLNTLIVLVSTEDWDGRYLYPLLPFLFLLAAAKLSAVFEKNFLQINRVL